MQFEVRRHSFNQTITEIRSWSRCSIWPPAATISVRVLIVIVVPAFQRYSTVKLLLRLAIAAATAVAALIVTANPPDANGDVLPRTWLILAVAVPPAPSSPWSRSSASSRWSGGATGAPVGAHLGLGVMLVALVISSTGLELVLIIYNWQPGHPAALPRGADPGVPLVRPIRLQRNLTELYELTRAMADAGRNGPCPTCWAGSGSPGRAGRCWLAAHGAAIQENYKAAIGGQALDVNNAAAAAEQAMARARDRGGRDPDERPDRTLIRPSGVKDAIVVPARSSRRSPSVRLRSPAAWATWSSSNRAMSGCC